ncbi:MAG: neutral/alkaline non-lysosomal ceramidase N-terminal domain-containing protein [Pirellulaceae bacterium]|jgi:hypothetical protein|nr:neutral/alkaline non-lysosomal ceramidase N-terminal domain-containing protein [Pirellulaceae bacterium]
MRFQPLIVGLALVLSATTTTLAAEWKAGVAKVKITPAKPLRMGGYSSRNRPADGTVTDLWAKALVLQEDSGTRAVLITVDVNNISRDLSTPVCEELHKQFGLERGSIAFNASHTHSGPAMGARAYYTFTDQQHQDLKDYTAELQRKLIAVAGEALRNLAPAKLSWGNGKATFAVNRRNNREADVPKLRTEGKLRGPVDHDVPVLFVQNPDGRITAVACGYACHATTLSGYQISADWPGYAQIELEKKYPDAIALTWIGCGGDQNPLPRRKVEYAQDYGRQLAQSVENVQSDKLQPIAGQLVCSYAEIDMPFAKLPTRDDLRKTLDSKNRFEVARAKTLLQRLQRDGKLKATYPYPVQVWKLGDGPTFVLLGGEVVVDYSVRLKQELGADRTWVAGYSNDVLAYIPSRRVLLEGGYEGGGAMLYYGHPSPWAKGIEQKIISEVHRQVEQFQRPDKSKPQ